MATRATKKKAAKKTAVRSKSTPKTKKQGRAPSASEPRKAAVEPAIHCALAPADLEIMLLPTSVIEEVTDYEEPKVMNDTPDWLLGQIEWNNRQVPVISYSALIHASVPEEISAKSRIMIIKSLADSTRVPYLGVLLSDIPSLDKITRDELFHLGDDRKSLGVFSRVNVRDQEAVIPDLDRLTHLVTHAAYGALPITQLDD